MAATPRQRFMSRLGELKKVRAPWDDQYRQIADYVLPWRYRESLNEKGRRPNDKILDPTATLSVRTCAAGMATGFCSSAREWWRPTTPRPELAQKPKVKTFLYEAQQVINWILQRSGFYGVTSGSAFYDLVGFATFGMFVEEDLRRVASFKPLPVGQYWLQADAKGQVDTIYRHFPMTVGQLVEEFGLQACSPLVQDQHRRGQFDVAHPVLHLVEPNRRDEETGFEGRRAGLFDWRGMAFRSVWMETARSDDRGVGFLRTRGYHEFPAVTPRWGRTSPEDVYGTGPCHEALPDIKQLQTLKRRLLQLIEKSAIPALRGPGGTGGKVPSQLPGAYNPQESGGPGNVIEPIFMPLPAAIQQVREELRVTQYGIREALFADLWRLMTDDQRAQPATAEEIRAKREERLLLLGPVGNNVEDEYLARTIDRVYYMAERAGMLPEVPEELLESDLKIEFISVMASAQRAQEIPAVERVAAFVKALSALDEEVIDKLDADKFADRYAEFAGIAPDLMRTPEAVEALRQGRAEKRAAQEQMQAAAAAATGAKDLSQANLENDNALSRIIGAMGPVAASQAGVPAPLGGGALQ